MTEQPTQRKIHGEAGFTLVEMLAALVLASLIFLGLNMSMTSVRQGADRAREALSSQSALSTATGIFARDVARVAKIRRGAQAGSGYLFEGTARRMIYPLAEREGTVNGGLYLVRLRVVDGDKWQQRLIRERAPLQPGASLGLSAQWQDPVVLLDGPFDIAFAYRAQRSGARGWSDGWSAAEAMPEQVRLTIGDRRTGRLRIPVLVQALQVDTEVDCAGPGRGCPNAEPRGAAQ
jgi:general secretion pathway protein J